MFPEKPAFQSPETLAVFEGVRKAIEYSLLETVGAIAHAKGFVLIPTKEFQRLQAQDLKIRLESEISSMVATEPPAERCQPGIY